MYNTVYSLIMNGRPAAPGRCNLVLGEPRSVLDKNKVAEAERAEAGRLQNAVIVTRNFKWDMTGGFRDAIRAKASRQPPGRSSMQC
jgi:hypothetical protein